jgi:hypothetical protein
MSDGISSALDVCSFRGDECATDHCLVLAEVMDALSWSKQAAQKFYMEQLNLRKVNKIKVREQYELKISNRSATLESLDECGDINRASTEIRENNKLAAKGSPSTCEYKLHKPWSEEEC